MDTLLQRPMHLILQQMPFSEEIMETIAGQETAMSPYLNLAVGMDKIDWDAIDKGSHYFDLTPAAIEEIHNEANEWAENAFA